MPELHMKPALAPPHLYWPSPRRISQLQKLSEHPLTSLTLLGNATFVTFVAMIYAPDADVGFSFGGNSTLDVEGTIVANSLTTYGHCSLHYDENLARAMPGPATLDSAGITNNNQFRFVVTGVPGFNYAVLASTNLTDWSSVITNVLSFEFLDADSANYPQRFYRSLYLP